MAQTNLTASGTPYLDIAKAYEEQARKNLAEREAVLAQQLAQSKQSTNANYDSAAAGNYVNYMKQQNALPEQLARQGIRGGASESAMTRIANNYAQTQGANTAARYAALGQLQNAYDTNIASMRQSTEDAILNNAIAQQQNKISYEDVLAQRAAEEKRYNESEATRKAERNEDIERAAKEREEDRARDEERYQYEKATEAQRYADELAWRDYQEKTRISEKAADRAYDESQLAKQWAREDELTAGQRAYEDAIRKESNEREDKIREEAYAREDKQRAEDQAIAREQYEDEKYWRQIQYNDNKAADELEKYSATLGRFTTVDQCNNAIKELEEKANAGDTNAGFMIWLLQLRRAEIVAEKKNK